MINYKALKADSKVSIAKTNEDKYQIINRWVKEWQGNV